MYGTFQIFSHFFHQTYTYKSIEKKDFVLYFTNRSFLAQAFIYKTINYAMYFGGFFIFHNIYNHIKSSFKRPLTRSQDQTYVMINVLDFQQKVFLVQKLII